MKFIKSRAYVGANEIAPAALVHLRVSVEGPQNWPDDSVTPDCTEALLKLLPGLAEHPGSSEDRAGFVTELRRPPGLPLAYVAGRIATELQRREGARPKPMALRMRPGAPVQDIIFQYDDSDIGVLAGEFGVIIALALLPPEARPASGFVENFDAARVLEDFRQRERWLALDQTALAIIDEARRRDIPWFALDRSLRLVQLGQGSRLRRIRETVTDRTPNIAAMIQRDKSATNRIFNAMHLPVPRQAIAANPEAAVRAARDIGYPVVVKPLSAGKGLGISVGLESDDAVRAAFAFAKSIQQRVLIESYIPGFDHRILVVGGRIVAAALRLPAAVTGDGRSTVAALVAETNKDPRRGAGFSKLMNRIELDDEAGRVLRLQGYTRDSVPPADAIVVLRATANISTGGTAIDVTDSIHPENRTMLLRAARVCGLDIAGIDFLTPDISQSYRAVGGGLCEINASPGLRPHQVAALRPDAAPRDVVGPIVDLLFPNGHNGRIPTAAITGTNGKTTTARMLAHILRHAGGEIGAGTVGLVTTSGVHIDGTLVARGDFSGRTGARALLRDPLVDLAVLETARGGIAKSGLGFDWCDVGAVLNVTADHIGIDGVGSLDDMARLKGRVIEASRSLAVLNADDPRCLALAALKPPAQVCLVSGSGLSATLRDHLTKGGLAVCLDGDSEAPAILLHRGPVAEAVIPVQQIPATLGGAARHNVENAMFAVALAHGLGISTKGIAEALGDFRNDAACNPGRFNICAEHPFTAILDFAHNPDGVRAVCDTLRCMEFSGRRICVLANAGNRHGEHIEETAGIVARAFDFFVCSRDATYSEANAVPRDFPAEEIPERLAAALIARGVEARNIQAIDSYRDAVDAALQIAAPGDLLMVFSDATEWCWDRIVGFGKP